MFLFMRRIAKRLYRLVWNLPLPEKWFFCDIYSSNFELCNICRRFSKANHLLGYGMIIALLATFVWNGLFNLLFGPSYVFSQRFLMWNAPLFLYEVVLGVWYAREIHIVRVAISRAERRSLQRHCPFEG